MIDTQNTYTPADEVIELIHELKCRGDSICLAEIGVGYGITALSACIELDENDTYVAFDFEETVRDLLDDLGDVKSVKCALKGYPNSGKYWDSYAWSISELIYKMRNDKLNGLFDLVYLDGAHNFFTDGLTCCLLKECLKPNGYIVFDDVCWTYSSSETCKKDDVLRFITEEQFEDQQVLRVIDMFMENDPMFKRINLWEDNKSDRVMILVTLGQHSYNTRTRFLNYPDRIPELFGQRWHLITNLSKM